MEVQIVQGSKRLMPYSLLTFEHGWGLWGAWGLWGKIANSSGICQSMNGKSVK
jgi:hypothetical protein